jgi:C_GCAxxG_C_C family probable redox protein
MDKKTRSQIMEEARDFLNAEYHWHCSEGIFKAVGAYYLNEINPQSLRMTTPFAGGIGSTYDALCGALSGGIMMIGAIHGRIDAKVNDDHCMELAKMYRERFIARFGCARCGDLREEWGEGLLNGTCADLVAEAAGLLVDVLEEGNN